MSVLLLLAVVLLSSCGSREAAEQAEDPSTDLIYSATHVEGTLCEGVTVDVDIPDLSNCTRYDMVSAHLQLPDDEVIQSMKEYIFAGYAPEEIREEHLEGQHINYFTDDMYEGPWLTTIADPTFARISFYNSKAWQDGDGYISFSRTMEMGSEWEEAFGKDQLAFMDRDDAVKEVEALLSEWGIEPIGDPEVYCLDFEGLCAIQHGRHSTFKPELGHALDCYLMRFDVGYQNIPYTFYEFDSKGIENETYGAELDVYFTDQGIMNFNYDFANYLVGDVVEPHDSIIPLDQAMGKLKEQYENIIITSEIYVAGVYFQYIPTLDGTSIGQKEETGETILVPAWVIQPATMLSDGEWYLDPVIVNAITGQEMM